MIQSPHEHHDWEKVLWKRQPYPDNYVPPSAFLASLRKNPNFRPYSYWPLVVLACSITQHLAIIFIFLAIFVRLKEQSMDPRSLICISVVFFFLGYATWNSLDQRTERGNRNANHLKAFKSAVMMFLTLMSLSPVLRTLTAATSSDSIWALASILFSLNALLSDYTATEMQDTHEGLSSVLSMNAAVSASVVLASRLHTDVSVFALMLYSIQSFALYPMLRHRLQTLPVALWLLFTIALWTLAVWLIGNLSRSLMWLSFSTLSFVTVIAPGVLVWAQRYKNIIRGPWDVAVPKVN
ncbi:phosphatidylinositol N-acetylglucosaminyltransferase [Agrocybe pediades]|nr:phosphatidylinositol N-acetylglucosaminyltransferase [Agrocybe pediades]